MTRGPVRGRRMRVPARSPHGVVALGLVLALVVTAVLAVAVLRQASRGAGTGDPATAGRRGGGSSVAALRTAAPSANGYFPTLPPGSWRRLPGDQTCAERVHRSTWEPRPSNTRANTTMPDPASVHASLTARPRGAHGTYDSLWNSWLLPRVDGRHTGTTDENIQWAACKWGISDNLLRAVAAGESTWFQYLVDPATGQCVELRGCGDLVQQADGATRVFCDGIDRFGHDYQKDYAPGRCPRTFSIVGVMAWQDPAWGRMQGNQNGTFPFSRDSTAFALDYLGSFLRGCQEGWPRWLSRTGDYQAGDIWGCVGVWYAGTWHSTVADDYAARIRDLYDRRVWLDPDWAEANHSPLR